MNKILTLYNIEFKRIYKLYIALLGGLVALNLAIVGSNLYSRMVTVHSLVNSTGVYSSKPYIGLLKTQEASRDILSYDISNMYMATNLVLGLSVILCLLYAIAIWYRDFLGKSKTAYTLFMLPNNKFNIYISKAITIVVMIYGVMIAQMITWLISAKIISILTGLTMPQIIDTVGNGARMATNFNLIQPYPVDFIMINIVGVILAVVVIFTGVMMQLAEKKKGIVLGILYVLGVIMMYIGTMAQSEYSDVLLIYHIISYIVVFAVSMELSYRLLNKKIYM